MSFQAAAVPKGPPDAAPEISAAVPKGPQMLPLKYQRDLPRIAGVPERVS